MEAFLQSIDFLPPEQKAIVLQNLSLHSPTESATNDKRKKATALNEERENNVLDILSGKCEDTNGLRAQMLSHIPGVVDVKKEGGLGKHYDYTLILADGTHKTLELKTSQGKWKVEDLTWKPWEPAVQFLQGQVKSKLAQKFIGTCGVDMLQAFFDSFVRGFVDTDDSLLEARGLTWEGYLKGATSMKVEDIKGDDKAQTLFTKLRANPSLAEQFRLAWIAHEEAYLGAHTLDHTAFAAAVKEVIESKDWWLCRVKNGDSWIEGFHVLHVEYKGVERKRDGGHQFQYTMRLQKKSGGEFRDVPITWKLYWKNGGQGVQNLNYLVL